MAGIIMNEFKKDVILDVSKDIVEFIDDQFAIEVDLYDIAGLLNYKLNFLFDGFEDDDDMLEEENNNG